MKVFLKSLIFILFLTPSFSYSYEPETTHAGLSQEIVDFYNFFSYPQITVEEKELIIQGAIDEDFPEKRSLNHFYDPVRNIGFNGFPSAKQWANGEIISNEFSWDDALNSYAKGDEETAFITLGHIIHLIEDMGVPDHTRNDPHKGDGLGGGFTNESPYEKWASENKNRQTLRGLYLTLASEGIRPKVEISLGNYFDFLANYSNKNFFSKDTIVSSLFKYTEPVEEELIGDYMMGQDSLLNKKIKLYIYVEDLRNKTVKRVLSNKNDTYVLSSYFDRLSRQIIPAGAGVIELFFKEAKEAREKYEKEQEELKVKEELRQKELLEAEQKLAESGFWDKVKYKIQYVWEYNVKSETFAVAKRLREIMTEGPVNLAQQGFYWTGAFGFTGQNVGELAAINAVETAQKGIEEIKETNNFIQEQNPITLAVGPALAFSEQSADNDLQPINEQPAIEPIFVPTLLNPIQNPFLGGGEGVGFGGGGAPPPPIVAQEEIVGTPTPEIVLEVPQPDITPPDISVSVAECTYSLVSGLCFIATSTVNISWTATATDTAHYQLSIDNVFLATTTSTTTLRTFTEGTHSIKVLAFDIVGNVGTSSEIIVGYMKMPLVISEIAWAGTASSTANEWMEIYNRSSHTINLSGVSLKAIDGTPDIALSGTVTSLSFYLIERSDDNSVPGVSADLTDIPFSGLSGSGLSNDDGEEMQLIQNTGTSTIILDKTMSVAISFEACDPKNWCFGNSTTFSTMARRNLNGLGTAFPSWTTDNTINIPILESTGMTIRGTPKGPYVVPGGGEPIVPF